MIFEDAHIYNFKLSTCPYPAASHGSPNGLSRAHGRAQLHLFRAPLPKVLQGEYLRAVNEIERSLCRQGLLAPLIVSQNPAAQAGSPRTERKLIIIDGQKRLMALRRLCFDGRLPAGLMTVPYVFAHVSPAKRRSARSIPSPVPAPCRRAKTIAA